MQGSIACFCLGGSVDVLTGSSVSITGTSPAGIVSDGQIYCVLCNLRLCPSFWLVPLLSAFTAIIPACARKAYVICFDPRLSDTVRIDSIRSTQYEKFDVADVVARPTESSLGFVSLEQSLLPTSESQRGAWR